MKVSDILGMSQKKLNKLFSDKKMLSKAVSTLASAGNKRYNRLVKKGMTSQATTRLESTGGKLGAKGKTIDELKREFIRAKNFLQSPVSTVKGYKKLQKETIQRLEKEGVNITPDNWQRFWQSYEKLKELDPNAELSDIKYRLMEDITDEIEDDGLTPDEIALNLQDRVSELYEEQQEQEQTRTGGGVSRYYK